MISSRGLAGFHNAYCSVLMVGLDDTYHLVELGLADQPIDSDQVAYGKFGVAHGARASIDEDTIVLWYETILTSCWAEQMLAIPNSWKFAVKITSLTLKIFVYWRN